MIHFVLTNNQDIETPFRETVKGSCVLLGHCLTQLRNIDWAYVHVSLKKTLVLKSNARFPDTLFPISIRPPNFYLFIYHYYFILAALGLCCGILGSIQLQAQGFNCPEGCGILVKKNRDRTHIPCPGRRVPNHWTKPLGKSQNSNPSIS